MPSGLLHPGPSHPANPHKTLAFRQERQSVVKTPADVTYLMLFLPWLIHPSGLWRTHRYQPDSNVVPFGCRTWASVCTNCKPMRHSAAFTSPDRLWLLIVHQLSSRWTPGFCATIARDRVAHGGLFITYRVENSSKGPKVADLWALPSIAFIHSSSNGKWRTDIFDT